MTTAEQYELARRNWSDADIAMRRHERNIASARGRGGRATGLIVEWRKAAADRDAAMADLTRLALQMAEEWELG